MNIFNKWGGLFLLLLLACDPPGTKENDPPGTKEKPKVWSVRTLAGGEDGFADNKGDAAQFNEPSAIAISDDEQSLYIADTGNNRIRKIDIATGEVTTLAGSSTSGSRDDTGTAAQFDSPRSIAAQGGKLYVADNAGIREITIATRAVTTRNITGISRADSLAITPDGKKLYVLIKSAGSIREVNLDNNTSVLLAGGGGTFSPTDSSMELDGSLTPGAPLADFNQPESMAISPDGASLVVADDGNASRAIRAVAIEAKAVLTLGNLDRASVTPTGGAADPKIGVASGIYIADSQNSRIKQLKLETSGGAIVVDFAGNSTEESKDGPLQQANFSRPEVIAVNSAGTKIFVIDSAIDKTASPAVYTHHRVRMIEYK